MADKFLSDEEFEKRLRPDYKPENDNSGYLSDEEFNAKLGGESSSESGNPVTRLGRGIVRGAVYGLPQQMAQAARFTGLDNETTRKVEEWGKAGMGTEERGVAEQAGEMIPQSVGIPIIANVVGKTLSMIPHPYAKAAGLGIQAAGTFLTPAMFGLSQAQQTKETAQERGITPGAAPYITGGIEWAGETVANVMLGRLFGPLSVLGKAGKDTVAKMGAAAALKGTLGNYVKEMALVQMPTEVLTEIGQNYFEALTEKKYGIRPEAHPMEEGLSAIAPTALMTALLGPFGRVAQSHFANKQATILSNPIDVDNLKPEEVDQYFAIRKNVANSLAKVLPNDDLRKQWLDYANQKIDRNLPLDINSPIDSLSLQIDSQMDNLSEQRKFVDEPIANMPIPEQYKQLTMGPQGELYNAQRQRNLESAQGFSMVGGVDQSQPLSLEAQQLRNYENAVNTGMAAPTPQSNQPQYTTNEDGSIRITTTPTPAPTQESLTPIGQQAITDYFGENKSGLNIKEAHNPNGSFVYLGKGLGTDIEGTTIPYTEEEHKQYRKLEAQLKGGLITQKQFSEQTKALGEGVLKRGVETTTETPSPITTTPEGTMRVAQPKSQAVPHPSEFNTFNEYATALGYNAPQGMSIGEFAKTNAAQMAQNKTSVQELTGKWNNRGKAEVNKETQNKTKEPWQMTRDEWLQSKDISPEELPYGEIQKEWEGFPIIKEYRNHEKEIKKALKQGKPVPQEVLKDYPNLQPTQGVIHPEVEPKLQYVSQYRVEPRDVNELRDREAAFSFLSKHTNRTMAQVFKDYGITIDINQGKASGYDYVGTPYENFEKVIQDAQKLFKDKFQPTQGVQDEEITQITSDIGQNRGRELPAGTISRSNPMPNDTTTINARTAIGKIAKAFGKSVVWVDINDENEVMFSGLVSYNLPNRIIINAKTKIPHLIILGHEIFHEMKRESPELYQKFRDYIIPLTQNTPKFKKLLSDVYKKQGLRKTNVPTDLMYEELMSEFAGEQFISREFWENMAKTNPTLFEKVIDIARKMINQAVKALGANKDVVGEQYFKDVQTARKMLADVMGEYSKGKLKGEVGEGVKYSAIPYIDDIIDSFTNHTPKNISPEIVSKFRNSFEVAKDDFKPHQEYFSLPWWNAKKDKMWELAFKIFGIDRIERRSQLKADFAKIAEPFFEYQKTMKQAGKTSTQIKEGQRLISRALISGDALLGQELNDLKEQLGAYQKGSPEYNKIAERIDQIQTLNRYSDEELANGFVDEYGNTIKLQQEEIKAYKSVRAALDNMFTEYVDHLAKQQFRQYRRQAWYSLLVSAAGFDLNKSQTETILGEGLKKAALLRARKVQVNVQTVFDEINGGIEKGAIEQEALKAGKIYSKIAEKMGKEIGKLEEAVAYVTNETDKAKVRKTTEELLNAYIMTRPSMKKIKDLRNDYKKSVAYFPRVRPEGKMKIKLVKDIYNKEGQKIDEREIDMQMFDNQHQGMKIMQSMIDKHGKNGNLPEGVHFTDVERTVKTPEFAFQGVNDINMQKVLDSAIQGIELKEKVFDENGNAIDVQELLRDMGYQAIAAQFQSRGFARRGIHRNPDLVKGYQEEDLQQVLKDYISGMSGIMTKQEAAADFLDLMKEVSKEGKPEKFRALATYGKNQLRNDTKADRFSSKIRAFMFTYYLAGVVRMVAAQLSQNYTTAIPDEAEYLRNIGQGGLGKAEKDYHIAMKDVIANKWGVKEATNEIETRMLTQMMDTGITQDQYVRQLFGHMKNEFRNKWNKTLDVLAIPMSGMEIFNRKSAALTRFRHAYPEAMKKVGTVVEGEEFTAEDAYNEAFDEARNAVNSTHFAMSKANLPLWAQGEGFGVVAKTLMTFKTFPQNYLLFMADANWKTRLHSLAYIGAFGGLMGLPFMKDLFDWVEKEFGLNFNRSIRQTLRGVGGKHLEDLGVNGIPAMLGANLSASLAIGLPFTESAEQTIGGVYAGQYQKMKRAYQALKRNDYARAAQNIFPEFARAPLMAVEQSQFGKDVFGRPGMAVSPTGEPILNAQGKPLSMTNSQAALKALGFNPTDYGREQEMNQIIRRQEKWVTEKKANISQTLKFDRLNGDPNALTNAKKATDELKQGIKDRGIQDLVPHFTFTDIVKASKKKAGAKERREARYKREELS